MFYSDEIIEEVRFRSDIVDIIGSYVTLSKKGANHVGLCPFHSERTPSFSVSAAKQMYYCFGCGAGGNVFTFVMQYENYNFVEALKALADRSGVTLPEEEYDDISKKTRDTKAKILEVYKLAAKYYYYKLKSDRGRNAYEYLMNRGLTDRTVTRFGLGYADKYPDELYQYLKKQGYDDLFLKKTGLVSIDEVKGGYDKFFNRVMFPIMDAGGNVIAFGGRVMGEGMPKYMNSPETAVFDKGRNLYGLNLARKSRLPYMLVCEGYMDVIALHQAGFANTVASLGTSFTSYQAKTLKRYVGEAVLTYDNDDAGIQATLRAIPILKEASLAVKVVNLKPHKDPDDFIKNEGAAAYGTRIEGAVGSFFFEVETARSHYDLDEPEQKTRFYNDLAKILLQFSEEIERNNYIEAAARRYSVDYEGLRRLVNKASMNMTASRYAKDMKDREREQLKYRKSRPDEGMRLAQKHLLNFMADDYGTFARLEGIVGPGDFTGDVYGAVAGLMFEQYRAEGRITPARIINHFAGREEQAAVADIFMARADMEADGGHLPLKADDAMTDDAQRRKAFADTVVKVLKNNLEAEYDQAIEGNDIMLLQKNMQKQKEMEQLHYSLLSGKI